MQNDSLNNRKNNKQHIKRIKKCNTKKKSRDETKKTHEKQKLLKIKIKFI